MSVKTENMETLIEQLEKEIERQMNSDDRDSSKRFTTEDYAKSAVSVVKKHIKDALDAGIGIGSRAFDAFGEYDQEKEQEERDNWLKSKGLK